MPNIDPILLIAHIEYASWALKRTLECIDKLSPEAITHAPGNSCRSILATLRHLYETDWYYFSHLTGGTAKLEFHEGAVRIPGCKAPDEYEALRARTFATHHTRLGTGEYSCSKDTVLHGWGTWSVWQVVMQMANHTTHHLGQISTLLRQAGYAPTQSEWTDLILYYVEKFPAASACAEV